MKTGHMKATSAVAVALLSIVSQVLIGCGSTSPAGNATAPSSAALTGNWNLLGNRSLQQYPLLSLAIVVDGNQITAQGDSLVLCALGGGGGSVGLSGQIAADGTFSLNEAVGDPSSFQWAITGTAPPPGGSTWTGTYKLTTSPTYSGCTLNQTAAFTATELPPFDGTYVGTFFEGPQSSPTATVAVTINVSQGSGALSEGTGQAFFPLSATLTVSGSPCFTSGTSSTILGGSVVKGDSVGMNFNMNDGSQAVLFGDYASPDESTLTQVSLGILNGQCGQTSYSGTLTRQ